MACSFIKYGLLVSFHTVFHIFKVILMVELSGEKYLILCFLFFPENRACRWKLFV